MTGAEFLLALVPLFVIVDPLASVGLFLGLTQRNSVRERQAIALKAALFAALVLILFALAGRTLLEYLGIELYSLRVAGGILLVLIGLNMLKEGEEVPTREIAQGEHIAVGADGQPLPAKGESIELITGGQHSTEPVTHDPSFVPLGLPMLAGPGAISLVIVQATQFGLPTIGSAIAVTMVASALVLLVAARASHIIGDNGRRVITRIMGLLTVAFAVQYVLDGVDGWLAAR